MIKIGLTDFTPSDKIIEIRDKYQVVKAKYAISATDILKHTLMGDHYIEISFPYNKDLAFKRSDYIVWEGSKFTLREDYIPEQENKIKFKYTLKFEAIEMLFQDIRYYYLNQNLEEADWRLTSEAASFIKIAVDNINRYFGGSEFSVGLIEPTETKYIPFDKISVFDALTEIAEQFEAEWQVTGKTINLVKRISFGSPIDFETEVSVLSMSRSEGENSTNFNRIVALGSTRNIPANYRKTGINEGVDAIYQKRLRIPVNKGGVINLSSNMSPEEVVEGTVIFEDIYPKRIGTLESVDTIEYQDEDSETKEVTKWNAFKFKDSGIKFKKEYILKGEELRLSFQSGDCNGFDFALIFHESGYSKTDNSQYFEIVRNEDYGSKRPNETLKPKVGDQYVLYGFDIALVSDQYVPLAEQELFDKATKWLKDQTEDKSVYECPTVIKYFSEKEIDLEIGQKVRLISDLLKGGSRESRIMGFEKKLYNKYNAIYIVGDNAVYSRLASIEKEVKELQYAGFVYEKTAGSGNVYLIKQFDETNPTDFNTYSAKASDAKFLNKRTGGKVQGDTLFEKNVQVQGTTVTEVIQNATYNSGAFGSGYQLKNDSNGSSYLEVDYIDVRKSMTVYELMIAKIKSVGGSLLLSLASMKTIKVEDYKGYWRCYFDSENGNITNDFKINDQALSQTFTGTNIKRYWCLVVGIGSDYIDISKKDKEGVNIPEVGDEIIQLGNRNDANRQSAILLSAYGSDAPSIKQYNNINSYLLEGKEVTSISPKGNKFRGNFEISTNGTSTPIYKDLGLFVNGRTYYLNDRVSHLGSYWVCIVNTTVTTPNESSVMWRKETAGQADINKAVDTVQIGGRNYVKGSDIYITEKDKQFDFASFKELRGKTITISVDIEVKNATGNRIGFEPSFVFTDGTVQFVGVWYYITSGSNFKGRISSVVTLPDKEIKEISQRGIFVQCTGAVTKIGRPQLEIGNKATDWKLALEDLQDSIDVVRSETHADFKVLNDKVESKVSQTDFNSLGSRVSASESKINQTAEQITLKVDNIQIGSQNLLSNSNKLKIGNTGGSSVTSAMESDGSLRIGVIAVGPFITNFLINPTLNDSTLSDGDMITISYWLKGSIGTPFNFYLKAGMGYYTMHGTVSSEYKQFSISVPYKKAGSLAIHLLPTKIGLFWLKCLQVEKGNKASDWSPATEDIPAMVGSTLILNKNEISLASNTIKLKGSTIADAIQTEDLKVGDRTKLAAVEVLKDGTFYAKGSKSKDESLIIDSDAQSIEVISPYSSNYDINGSPVNEAGKSIIKISGKSGGVRVFNQDNNMAMVSANGLSANYTGLIVATPTSTKPGLASIAGLGFGTLQKSNSKNSFITGVFGSGINTIPDINAAPTYGGYFESLCANGFILNTRKINGIVNEFIELTKYDSLIIGSSTVMQTVYLPDNAYEGTIIRIKQWQKGSIRITPKSTQKLCTNSSPNNYVDVTEGWEATLTFIGEENFNGAKFGTWLISKYKF